jgi:protein-L-isoaspartate(D-aspartate) O-methyltransferase
MMTELLGVERHHRVLEVGTGSGYQAAVLGRLAERVVTIERYATLAETARQILSSLAFDNVQVIVGDGSEGAAYLAPFDRILVAAGSPAVPPPLRAQLADGGRLVIPVGPTGFQRLHVVDRMGEVYREREDEPCVFVPLLGRHGWPESPAKDA